MTSSELIYEDKFKENGCIQRYIRYLLAVSEQIEGCSFIKNINCGCESLISAEQTVSNEIFLFVLQILDLPLQFYWHNQLFDD